MRNNRLSKRRRQESAVHDSTDSTEDDTVSDGNEYYHRKKGKRKIKEVVDDDGDDDDVHDQEEGEKKDVEPSVVKEEKVIQVCGICLTEEEVERGKLDCCDHYFCFGCIMEWSKVESRCPTCKQRFVTIVRPPVPGVPRSRPRTFRIPLRNQVYEPSEEEILLFTDPYLHVVCSECQEAGDERLLLLCDRCDSAAHTYCVGLGRSVPRGDWFCNMCCSQVQGFNSDEQEHDEERDEEHNEGHDEEQQTELDEDDSMPLISLLIADVQPNQRRRLSRRRPSAPRLNRAGGRHTRLHPAPALSQAAMALVSPNQEVGRSSSLSSDIESTSAVARTLSSQRLLRQRVNDIRNNWDQIRRGELQFGTIMQSAPRTRASQAQAQAQAQAQSNTSAVPEAAPNNDISQAWSMMEQARALTGEMGVSNPASGTRASGNSGRIPTGREGTTVGSSRFSQIQEQSARTTTAGGSNQLVENTPRIHVDQFQEQPLRRANVREGGRLAESLLRGHRDTGEERSLRREHTRESNHIVESRSIDHRDQSLERNFRESNRLVESDSSAGHRIGRRSGRQDNDAVQDVHARSVHGRLSRDSNERNIAARSMPGTSGENERLRDVDRSGRRTQVEDEEGQRPRTRGTSRERRDMKEQVAHYVKAELKPLYRLGHIDKQQHVRIARMATQELLAAFGIEHLGPETRAFGSVSSACNHMSSSSTSSLFPNCCMQCVRHNVNKVVGVLVKKVVGTGIL